MSDKTLYDFENQDMSDYKNIEQETFKRAVDLNDKFLDAKTILEEISYDWEEFISFLEDEKISKYCQFKGQQTIEFDEELLEAIVKTLRQSISTTNKAVGFNSKKIKINRVIEG